jgi:hypothetical protein
VNRGRAKPYKKSAPILVSNRDRSLV